jgi:O-antigen/teichoic acid export membrane protein
VSIRSVIRDSAGTALSQYLARFAVLLRGVAAAAALGPVGYGAWNALNLLLDYGSYAACGAFQGLDLRLPPAAARGDAGEAARRMAGAWRVATLGGLAVAIATLLALASGATSLLGPWGWGPPLLMLVAVWFQLAIQYHTSALRAHGEFRAVSEALGAQAVLGGGLGIALVWRFGVWGLLAGWLLGSLVALLWMRRGAVRPPLTGGASADAIALVRLGFPVFALYGLSLVLRSVDRIALVRFGGPEPLGHYSLGLMVVGLVLFLPEAAATVLYPRLAAAAQGARDPEQTRVELRRIHRALAVTLPPVVALGMVWAAPVVGWLLPAFREGVPALRVLALGALLLSGATLSGYFVLAHGPRGRLLAVTAGVTLATVLLVVAVASRDPRPTAVAMASAAGYAGYALALVALGLRGLCGSAADRARFVAVSWVPALWAWGSALAACAVAGPESAGAAVPRSLAVAVAYVPVAWWFGRGTGLRRLAREWLVGRGSPTSGA